MGDRLGKRAEGSLRTRARAAPRRRVPPSQGTSAAPLSASETAWLAAVPTAAIAVAAIALLGPPLGRALLAPTPARLWSQWYWAVRPEPVEQGRYLVALTVPLLLAALTAARVRASARRPTSAALRTLVPGVQLAALAFVALCLLGQHGAFGSIVPPREFSPRVAAFFTWRTLLVAAAATLAALALVRSARTWDALSRWTRETRARRRTAGALAVVATAVWLLHAFNTERTIAVAFEEVLYNTYFTLDETFAVLDGRSPLVNFAAQYGSLWPYALAAAMSLLGTSVGVWCALSLTATGAGMLAIYAVLRRAARSSLRGLLLFLPLLATSFLLLEGTRANRYTFANYFGTFPLRYAGPSVLAWLVARRLDDARPRRAWALFAAAGLVVLNNADAGVPALGATVAALLWGGAPSGARLRRLALEAAGGLAVAYELVAALTLARAGALPDVGLLVRYERLFARTGFAMYPMPALGLHLVIYLTYVAALGVATVRALRAEPNRLLTGMLAWSAVFGLGAGAYYAGRSTPDDLPAMFFPWALALALLLIPAIGAIRTVSWRPPPIAAIACLFGFLAMACSLVQTPAPWEQLNRLEHTVRPLLAAPVGQSFVARHVRRGERVAILELLGHRIGANLGVTNVLPYNSSESVLTVEQLDETVADLRAAGGSKLFLDRRTVQDDLPLALGDLGFRRAARQGRNELWVDARRAPGPPAAVPARR